MIGVCFGAQLIAELLAGPGAVDDHPRGMQAGLVRLRSGAAVSSFHFERVRPDIIEDAGAVITAASKATDVEGFRFGQHVRGVQFHPELDPSQLHRRLCCYGDVVEAHGLLLSAVLRTVELREPRWTDRHWVDLVERPATEALRRAA
jgi:GMP synthase (glutamine-hydrolysing)